MGIFEKNDAWWVSFVDQDGKRRRQKAGSKSQALKLYQKRREEVRRAKLFPEEAQALLRPLTVDQVIDRYLPGLLAGKRSSKDDARYARYWKEAFGTVALPDLTPDQVERWRLKRLQLGRKPATVNRAVAFLKMVYNLAVRAGLVAGNPVARVKQLRENNSRVRYLLAEEEAALKKAAYGHQWLWIEFGYLTGLRQSEQAGGRKADVNLDRRVLTVPRSKHGECRHVTLSTRAAEILQGQMGGDSEWIWPGRNPINHITTYALAAALKKACLAAKVTNFHWHDLRHTYCSRLVMAGVSLRTVQVLAGHKTIVVTMRYAHLDPGHLLEAVERISPPVAPSGTVDQVPPVVPPGSPELPRIDPDLKNTDEIEKAAAK